MSFVFGVIVGYGLGWVIMRRPEWANALWRKLRAKLV
jgi:hypothetical protein